MESLEKTLAALEAADFRHPVHGHAFARSWLVSPSTCPVCGTLVLPLVGRASVQCLICSLTVHRACLSSVSAEPDGLAHCSSLQGSKPVLPEGEEGAEAGAEDPLHAVGLARPLQETAVPDVAATPPPLLQPTSRGSADPGGGGLDDAHVETRCREAGGLGPWPAASPSGGEHEEVPLLEEAARAPAGDGPARAAEPQEPGGGSVSLDEAEALLVPQECIPLAGQRFRLQELRHAGMIVGPTLAGTLVGGALGGPAGAIVGMNAAGKATFAVAGASLGYHQAKRRIARSEALGDPEGKYPPFWAERAQILRETAARWHISARFNASDNATQALLEDCLLEEKVGVLVAKLLLNKHTLPGYLYEKLMVDFYDRHPEAHTEHSGETRGNGVPTAAQSEPSNPDDCVAEPDTGTSLASASSPPRLDCGGSREHSSSAAGLEPVASPILDAMGLAHELIAAVLHYHERLSQRDESIIATINAVDRVVLGEIYPTLFSDVQGRFRSADTALREKLDHASAERVSDGGSGAEGSASGWDMSEFSQAQVTAAGTLAAVAKARTTLDKMRCLVRAVECTAAACPHAPTADDLVPALARTVALSMLLEPSLAMHSEVAFTDELCRDDLLCLGKEGFALTSVTAALSVLADLPNDEEIRHLVMEV
uniref:Phorbol-ester/DAG-type domain-containing protein n=1 Tax=Rhizochromulina marina TaxID=1034831 RepID=A0A6U1A6V6_9STRA